MNHHLHVIQGSRPGNGWIVRYRQVGVVVERRVLPGYVHLIPVQLLQVVCVSRRRKKKFRKFLGES